MQQTISYGQRLRNTCSALTLLPQLETPFPGGSLPEQQSLPGTRAPTGFTQPHLVSHAENHQMVDAQNLELQPRTSQKLPNTGSSNTVNIRLAKRVG